VPNSRDLHPGHRGLQRWSARRVAAGGTSPAPARRDINDRISGLLDPRQELHEHVWVSPRSERTAYPRRVKHCRMDVSA
jgi:hypothetical protein